MNFKASQGRNEHLQKSIERLVDPDLPYMMETKVESPDADHTPTIPAQHDEVSNTERKRMTYSSIIPIITALNIVFVLHWKRFCIHQNAYMPTA